MSLSRPWVVCLAFLALLALPARAQEAPAAEKPILVLDAGGHTALIRKVLFTPDGKELISVSDDKTIRFWDVATGEPLRVLRPPIGPGQRGMLFAAALSPDGRTLAVGGYTAGPQSEGCPIYLLALPGGRIVRLLTGHTNVINALAFTSDGSRLASGSADHTARVWNMATGEMIQTLEGHTASIHVVAYSPDGSRLATASNDKTGRIWDVATGKTTAVLRHEGEVMCVAWRPDGQRLATGGYDRAVREWAPDGTELAALRNLGNHVVSAAYSGDSRWLLATLGGSGAEVSCPLFDATTRDERLRFRGHSSTVMTGAFSPDGVLAATADALGVIHLWQTADGKPVRRLAGQGGAAFSAAWSTDGGTIAWGHSDRGSPLDANMPLEHTFRLADLTLGPTPDGQARRAVAQRGSLSLVSTGETTLAVRRGGNTIATIAMADQYDAIRSFTLLSGDRVALGTAFGLYLYDASSGKLIRAFWGHTGEIWAVAPSPDGRFLLSASLDQTVRIWDPDRDEPLLSLFDAGDDWVAWTPEGYYACSAGGERLVGWHVNNGWNALASYHPAADFHKRFYRPDVIKNLLQGGSLARAMELAGEQQPATTVAANLPPVVMITAPDRSGQRFEKGDLEVRALARAQTGQAVKSMRLLVDDRPYEGEKGRKAVTTPLPGSATAAEARETWTVRLDPGPHKLSVRAEGEASAATSEPIEVVIADRRVAVVNARPDLYVLCIGIDAYPGDLRLKYAAKDARTLAETLQERAAGLYGRVETKLVTDNQATRRGIIDGFRWLKQNATAKDVAVVFYSGHGASENGVFYLVPTDVDRTDLEATGVHGSQFRTVLAELKGRVLVLLDACQSGDAGRKGAARSREDLVRELSSDDYGVVVMCSSTGEESSIEDDAIGHGYFTAALVEALSGKGGHDADGLVYSTDLEAYVARRVRELSGDRQHAVTAKPAIKPFALAKP